MMPDHSLVTTRDMLSLVALVLLYFILPFEIAFVDAPDFPNPLDGLYIFNRVIDLVFLMDIVVQFLVAYPENPLEDGEDEADESTETGALGDAISRAQRYEYGLRKIAVAYLQGWLLIDAFAMVPSGFDIYFAIVAPSGEAMDVTAEASATLLAETANPDQLAAVRATRSVKLIKLIRIARMLKMLRCCASPRGSRSSTC